MRLFWKFFLGLWLIILLSIAGTLWLSLLLNDNSVASSRHMALQKAIDEASSYITNSGVAGFAQHEPLQATGNRVRIDVTDDNGNRVGGLTPDEDLSTRFYALSLIGREVSERVEVRGPDGKFLAIRSSIRLSPLETLLSIFHQPLIPLIIFPLLTLILSWLYARYLFAPVKHLRHVAALLATGQIGTRVHKSTTSRWDGFGRLGTDFNRMSDRLEQGFQQQQRIVREMTQELMVPFRKLRDAIETAQVDPTDQRVKAVEDEIGDMERVINHAISLSGDGVSRPLEDRRLVEVVELVSDVVRKADFEATQQTKHVRLHLATPIWVSGNKNLIQEAIDNVVKNAVHYTVAGSTVDVEVRSERKASGDSFVDIVVNDQGPPVADEILSNLFDARFDYSESSQDGSEQRRLGLSLAERAVRLHDGSIIARNRVDGDGLRVVIRLPMAEQAQIEEETVLRR